MKLRFKKIQTNNKACYKLQYENNKQWIDLIIINGQKYFTKDEIKDIELNKNKYGIFRKKDFCYIYRLTKNNNFSHARILI